MSQVKDFLESEEGKQLMFDGIKFLLIIAPMLKRWAKIMGAPAADVDELFKDTMTQLLTMDPDNLP